MDQRRLFRKQCTERDDEQCVVPWCDSTVTADPDGPGSIHHIIERKLWPDGGYKPKNGVCVCNDHHRMAEQNEIPPQTFWRWIIESVDSIGTYIPLPEDVYRGGPDQSSGDTVGVWTGPETASEFAVDKWGEPFDTPPHSDLREFHKYPSTRHLLPSYWRSESGTAEERTGRDDTGHTSLESFLNIPLVATIKCDGSNAMLVADTDEPVRARNGRDAEHESFDRLKQAYWDRNVYENLPDYLQVFGENMYAKHSLHYGHSESNADCSCADRNQAPPVDDLFLVFGVYDTRFDLWLSWPETERIADQIGFETVPGAGGHEMVAPGERSMSAFYMGQYEDERELAEYIVDRAEWVIDQGHEGIVVRSIYPFHYGQFEEKLGKFVRPNHVQTDEHWSHQQTIENVIDQ